MYNVSLLNKFYYVDFINHKYRICKEYISDIETISSGKIYTIYFQNDIERQNNEIFISRRKARQLRDKLNKERRKLI